MKYLLLFFFIGFANGYSQKRDSLQLREIVDEVLWNSTSYDNLRVLCKEAGPRLSGSPTYTKAVAMTKKMLWEAGADTVYTQECMVPYWVRGKKESGAIILKNGTRRELSLTALGNSEGSGGKDVSAKVIEVRSKEELEKLGPELEGKIVFLNVRMNPSYINTFRAYGESAWSRSRGPSMAAKFGAVGALVRTLGVNLNDVPHTGLTIYNDSFPKIPAVSISTNDAEFLSDALRNDRVKEATFKTYCKNLPDAKGWNVIGEIKGSDFPEEIITVGGHLDAWDLAEGANDDGTGVVQSIEVLRVMKALSIKPSRTIRAVLFANEENGLRGAIAYLANAKEKNEKHIFALESDAGGFTPRFFGFTTDDATYKKLLAWKPLFEPYGICDFLPYGGGADVNPLREIGTTVASFEPDSQRYFDIHHARTDVFENVSERELKLGAATMAALIYLVSKYGL